MPGWMKHKLESRLPGETSITSDMQNDTTLMVESEEELKSLLMRVKEERERASLRLKYQKTLRPWYQPHHCTANRREKVEAGRFPLLGLQSHCGR